MRFKTFREGKRNEKKVVNFQLIGMKVNIDGARVILKFFVKFTWFYGENICDLNHLYINLIVNCSLHLGVRNSPSKRKLQKYPLVVNRKKVTEANNSQIASTFIAPLNPNFILLLPS